MNLNKYPKTKEVLDKTGISLDELFQLVEEYELKIREDAK